jgi:hypothetical protein
MIITKLMGGLGNQLFQYAIARSLSIQKKTELKLDLTAYFDPHNFRTQRRYRLNFFNISESFANKKEIYYLKYGTKSELIGEFLEKINRFLPTFPLKASSYVKEKSFAYNSEIIDTNTEIYIEGYWQSEKYFKNHEFTIRNDLTLKPEFNVSNNLLANKMNSVNAVNLHVRRGDFISDPETRKFHGICSQDYYQKGINIILNSVNDPHFFVFSDEPEWAQKNLEIPIPVTFMTENGSEKDYEDLRLMSLCKHHIIANSSFSWWGAWLSNNPDKIVISPATWFNNPSVDTRDLIPDSWIKI